MSTESRMTASAVVGGLVLSVLPVGAACAGRGATAAGHARRLDRGRLDSGHRAGRARRAGRRRDGVGARRLDTRSRSAIASGRFEMRTLPPGPYLRARASRPVSSHRAVKSSTCGRAAAPRRRLRCGTCSRANRGGAASGARGRRRPAPLTRRSRARAIPAPTPAAGRVGNDDHGELAWRLRHARRGGSEGRDAAGGDGRRANATGRGARVRRRQRLRTGHRIRRRASRRTSLPTTPFSGQVNLLTSGSFDTPQQLFSPTTSRTAPRICRSARRSASTPTGPCAPALTQGDIASWIVAGEYTTRAPGAAPLRHRPVLQHAALRRRQRRDAARRDRRQPQRRRDLGVRHLRDFAAR